LERKGEGRVTGLIARDSHDDLIRVNASRGVVLCTGDYGNDRTMVERYCWPSVAGLPCVYEPAVNTGDGHKMGMWVGAAMDEPPHCAMLFDFAVFSKAGLFNLARQPWLYVNVKGERFMNEDLPWGYECAQIMQQEGSFVWSVWDGKYDREWPKMQSQCCKNMGPPTYLWDPKQLEEALENGNVIRARTIEELARQMEVPVETFKATMDRYNDLARKGEDADFGKHPDRLTTIDQPDFYACRMEARYMVILGGLKVNTRLEVLDREKKAIPGLYAAGNVSGSFFGNMYPTTVPGLTHSRAWTFGRLAGINAASRPL
jgi:fumarate reductase flavoprotein subunit